MATHWPHSARLWGTPYQARGGNSSSAPIFHAPAVCVKLGILGAPTWLRFCSCWSFQASPIARTEMGSLQPRLKTLHVASGELIISTEGHSEAKTGGSQPSGICDWSFEPKNGWLPFLSPTQTQPIVYDILTEDTTSSTGSTSNSILRFVEESPIQAAAFDGHGWHPPVVGWDLLVKKGLLFRCSFFTISMLRNRLSPYSGGFEMPMVFGFFKARNPNTTCTGSF